MSGLWSSEQTVSLYCFIAKLFPDAVWITQATQHVVRGFAIYMLCYVYLIQIATIFHVTSLVETNTVHNSNVCTILKWQIEIEEKNDLYASIAFEFNCVLLKFQQHIKNRKEWENVTPISTIHKTKWSEKGVHTKHNYECMWMSEQCVCWLAWMHACNSSASHICNLHTRLMSYSRASVALVFGLFVMTTPQSAGKSASQPA